MRPSSNNNHMLRIPSSTYRLQLHKGFSFDDAAGIADYLCELGISHVYASPYLQAAPGSTHGYDVVVIYETFAGSVAEGNPVLLETTRIPSSQRRNQVVVLVGPNMITNSELQAFQYSVDLVVSVSDLQNFRPVLRRGVARHQEFYRKFSECMRMAGA